MALRGVAFQAAFHNAAAEPSELDEGGVGGVTLLWVMDGEGDISKDWLVGLSTWFGRGIHHPHK